MLNRQQVIIWTNDGSVYSCIYALLVLNELKKGKSEGFDSCDWPSNLTQIGFKFFSPCEREIWCMTSKNYRAPLLHYIKLCASSQTSRWIQTGVTVQKRSIRVKIGNFLSRMTLKFDGWPWKTTGHLFHATLSFVPHFKAIGEFNLELQSGDAQFGSKSVIFYPVLPWNLTDDLQTKVTVRKRSIWVKISDFLSCATLTFDGWPWKTIGHLIYVASSFMHHFIIICEFKLELQSANG